MRPATVAFAAALVLPGCGRVIIPSIGLDRPYVQGGQVELDRGDVVQLVTTPAADGSPSISLPGLWLAGHRMTHGAPFARVPELRPGDDVYVNGVHFVVVRLAQLPRVWVVEPLGDLILLTSTGGPDDPRLAVICELVTEG